MTHRCFNPSLLKHTPKTQVITVHPYTNASRTCPSSGSKMLLVSALACTFRLASVSSTCEMHHNAISHAWWPDAVPACFAAFEVRADCFAAKYDQKPWAEGIFPCNFSSRSEDEWHVISECNTDSSSSVRPNFGCLFEMISRLRVRIFLSTTAPEETVLQHFLCNTSSCLLRYNIDVIFCWHFDTVCSFTCVYQQY